MHETRLVQDLIGQIDSVARRNSAGRVEVVRMEIGSRSHVTSETLRGQFEVLSQGSLAQSAELEITEAPEDAASDVYDVKILSIVVGEA